MIKRTISIDDAVDLLNSIVAADTPAIAALVANRVPCNKELADHDTVQVSVQHGGYHVGLLGVINGLFGVDEDGWGAIEMVWSNDDSAEACGRSLVEFRKRV